MSAAADRDSFVPTPFRVTGVNSELPDTTTLELAPLHGDAPTFAPGQFNMLYAFGIGEVAISFSGEPADRSRVVHTVRAVGAASTAIARSPVGAVLGVRGPFGSAWPISSATGRDIVIVAGGLGLAPLRPAIYQVLAKRREFRRVVLLIGMRRPTEILYRGLLERWRHEQALELELTVDRADPAWRGHVGVVPSLIPRLKLDPTATVALVCGPEIMMRFTVNALQDAGVAPERIHVSMERNMKCALGLCGRCQFGPHFICKDGPILSFDRVAKIFACREI